MYNVIKKMIIRAKENNDFDLADDVYEILSTLAVTFNAPSDWRAIGEELAEEYSNNNWIMDNCKLYEFEWWGVN